jgi:hypothetical protein
VAVKAQVEAIRAELNTEKDELAAAVQRNTRP